MTQEEKAKAYDKAINLIKDYNKDEEGFICVKPEKIFPELKESKDERIRKALIEVFSNREKYLIDQSFGDITVSEALAWLEKQGEQKVNYTTLVETGNGGINALVTRELPTNGCDEQKPDDKIEPTDYNSIDPHFGKPIDKVEPKFKIGDWVIVTTNECEEIRQIVRIEYFSNGLPQYIFSDGLWFGNCSNVRLWSIKDAKDGDVLQLGIVTVIFREYIGNENCKCYCSVCDGEFEIPSQEDDNNSYGYYNATPATKEQRDLLFEKMHEAGYEWDEEKKEPKKIVVPKFNIHDCVVKKHNSNINDFGYFIITDITDGKYWYNDRIICDITEQDEWELYEPVRQKPTAWSEEDETGWTNTMIMIKEVASKHYTKDSIKLVIDWLNSLKERIGG